MVKNNHTSLLCKVNSTQVNSNWSKYTMYTVQFVSGSASTLFTEEWKNVKGIVPAPITSVCLDIYCHIWPWYCISETLCTSLQPLSPWYISRLALELHQQRGALESAVQNIKQSLEMQARVQSLWLCAQSNMVYASSRSTTPKRGSF